MIRKQTVLFSLLLLCCAVSLFAKTANLLYGDTDVELEAANMTNGSYSNSSPEAPKWTQDRSIGYQSPSSIKLLEFCGIGVHDVKLPAGKYTFSFWAKGSEPGVVAYITVNKQDSSWPVALQNRADGVIRLTTDWKRYSHTFTADGNARYSAYYGIADKPAWFDRFMINAGEKPLDWVPTTEQTISVQLPEADGNVYPIGTRIPVTVLLKSFTGKPLSGEIKARIVDYSGKELARHKKVIQLDKTGKDTLTFSIPENRSGWFQIIASSPGAEEQYQTLVVTRPPEPTIPEVEPFIGLCHGETFPAAAKLIGIKWLQLYR